MSVRQYLVRYISYGMIGVVLVGILIVISSEKRSDRPTLDALTEPTILTNEVPKVPAIKSEDESPPVPQDTPASPKEHLNQFERSRSRVLLRQSETIKKQNVLSDVKTIEWIESILSAIPEDERYSLEKRLTMIDFIEEALAWKENPARNDIVDSLERTLKVNNFTDLGPEKSRLAVGDKMELFALLASESPERATALLEYPSDIKLSNVFKYAVKRFALMNMKGVDR